MNVVLQSFLRDDLIVYTAVDRPLASRDAIIKALTFRMPGAVVGAGSVYTNAQTQLRNEMVAPDKLYSKRISGVQYNTRVFKKGSGEIATLTGAMEAAMSTGSV